MLLFSLCISIVFALSFDTEEWTIDRLVKLVLRLQEKIKALEQQIQVLEAKVKALEAEKKAKAEWYQVKRVIDGDTIELKNSETVRYIGVDTPETVDPRKPVEYYGKEASEYNKGLVEGKKVRLEFDVQKKDRYGRLLAYVYLSDGTFVNAELVKLGYAQVATYPPNVKHQKLFQKLQREAREYNRGLWQKESDTESEQIQKDTEEEIVYITRTGSKYHRKGCRYLRRSAIPIKKSEAQRRGYTPCSVCRPDQ